MFTDIQIIPDWNYLRITGEESPPRTKYNAQPFTHPPDNWICNKREEILSVATKNKWKSENALVYYEKKQNYFLSGLNSRHIETG